MFDRVKHDREAARRGGVRNLPRRRMPSPESYTAARRPRHTPFYSKAPPWSGSFIITVITPSC
uniref:Uncharacterized protein n=1 Tax=Aegilops tauschii TaxID=37682 RepID=M8BD69_AEGTA